MLTVTTPSSTYDLTVLKTVKAELEIKNNDRDEKLSELIKQASAIVARHCKRVFAKETVSETLRRVRAPHIALQRFPVTAVSSITADGTALAAADYEVDAKRGLVYRLSGTCRIAWCYDEVVIAYTGGYDLLATLDRDLERATIEIVKDLFFSGPRDPRVRSVEVPGVISKTYYIGDFSPDGPMPPMAVQLLEPYIRHDAMFDD